MRLLDGDLPRRPVAESSPSWPGGSACRRSWRCASTCWAGRRAERYVEELRWLTGHDWQPGDGVLDRERWKDYWVRSWGARGLLHVWHDSATAAIVRGLDDEHYRPAEMCLKVAARHEVAGAGDGAARLAGARAAAGAGPGAALPGRPRRHRARGRRCGPASTTRTTPYAARPGGRWRRWSGALDL